MFPIAIGAADTAGVDLKLMSYCIMLGASDFSTPFGYQTNLMVYGPGGYKVRFYCDPARPAHGARHLSYYCKSNLATMDSHNLKIMTLDCHDPIQTTDYLKIGTPLQLVLWLVSTWVLTTSSLWYVSLIVTSAVLVVVATARLAGDTLRNKMKQGVGINVKG